VVRRALWWSAPGALAGVGLAVALAQLLRGVLVGVAAVEPWSLAGGAVAVLITAGVAAYVPARRVGRADLMAQLRR
jgi:ABC-type antimicrobial peptide transport system permease subunit